jgi:hypothetical protein
VYLDLRRESNRLWLLFRADLRFLLQFTTYSSRPTIHFAAGIFVRFSDWIQYTMIHFRSQALKRIIVGRQSAVVSVRVLHVGSTVFTL